MKNYHHISRINFSFLQVSGKKNNEERRNSVENLSLLGKYSWLVYTNLIVLCYILKRICTRE